MKILRALGNATIIALGSLVLALELAGTLPSPVLPLLVIGVVVPEIAPYALAFALVIAAFALFCARGRVRAVALGSSALAAVLALVPLAEFPATRAAAEAAVRDAFPEATPATPRAEPTPVAFTVLRDRRVRLRDGSALALDVYRPSGAGVRPTIVTIYGGAWIFGGRRDTRRIDEAYARRGFTVVSIDYRHAPAYRFPTQIDDVRDAIAAISRNARAWHVDPDRVALFGRSAGAELALLAAYGAEPVRVRAVVGYYAPTDLVAGYEMPPRPDPADVRKILRTYIGGPPEARPSAYRAASPLAQVRDGLPPTLLVVGLRDSLITPPMQRALRDALRAHGNRVAAVEIPWSEHVFDEIPIGLGTQIAEPVTRAFLERTLIAPDPRPTT